MCYTDFYGHQLSYVACSIVAHFFGIYEGTNEQLDELTGKTNQKGMVLIASHFSTAAVTIISVKRATRQYGFHAIPIRNVRPVYSLYAREQLTL
jgi:hypothetical protein